MSRRLLDTTVLFIALMVGVQSHAAEESSSQSASGSFAVELKPQKDESAPAGRMIISKKYSGDLAGSGVGQMLSKRASGGVAVYMALEEFSGTLNGRKGGFTLVHNGKMSGEGRSLDIRIVEGSGTGELKNISGDLKVIQKGGAHRYELVYEL